MSEEQFDWVSGEWTVLREQPLTAVYVGENGHVVIRQRSEWDSDQVILVGPENAVTLAEAIISAAGLDFPISDVNTRSAETSTRKPKSAAERQRLRRAKKHEETDQALKLALRSDGERHERHERHESHGARDSKRDSSVTDRDSVTELPLRLPAKDGADG